MLENLVLDNLGNRVVLVGPNGCGKSSVLEAIAALKEYVGSYHPPKPIFGMFRSWDGTRWLGPKTRRSLFAAASRPPQFMPN